MHIRLLHVKYWLPLLRAFLEFAGKSVKFHLCENRLDIYTLNTDRTVAVKLILHARIDNLENDVEFCTPAELLKILSKRRSYTDIVFDIDNANGKIMLIANDSKSRYESNSQILFCDELFTDIDRKLFDKKFDYVLKLSTQVRFLTFINLFSQIAQPPSGAVIFNYVDQHTIQVSLNSYTSNFDSVSVTYSCSSLSANMSSNTNYSFAYDFKHFIPLRHFLDLKQPYTVPLLLKFPLDAPLQIIVPTYFYTMQLFIAPLL